MSLCAAIFSFGIATHLRQALIPEFIFFATLFVYTGQRYYKIKKGQIRVETPRILWMKANEFWVKSILRISSILTCYFAILFLVNSDFPESNFFYRTFVLLFCGLICDEVI